MGSEGVGHLSMYYTEEEPPIDFIGKRRHYFGKPSIRGITSVNQAGLRGTQGDPSETNFGGGATSAAGFSNVPSGQVILRNPESSEALRNLCSSSTDLRQKFENQFRGIDAHAQGIIRKDDFVNVLFDISKDLLQPS